MMRTRELLILDKSDFFSKISAFNMALETSPSMRSQFVDDPSGTIISYIADVSSESIRGHLNKANRLLFSVLTSGDFMKWAAEYQDEFVTRVAGKRSDLDPEDLRLLVANIDRGQIYKDLVGAIRKYGDDEIISSLLYSDAEQSTGRVGDNLGRGVNLSVAVEIETLAYAVLILIVFAIDLSPVRSVDLSRRDLQKAVNGLVGELQAAGKRLRENGVLSGENKLESRSAV